MAGTTVMFLIGLWAPALFWDPRSIRSSAMAALFPWKNVDLAFILFASYTMIVHCPIEEIFWRGIVLDPNGPPAIEILLNGLFFYLVHVSALAYALGRLGWLLAVPAGVAGAGWSWVTRRSGSLWPALVSHGAVDLAILWGFWFFFVRGGIQA
jgi:membrane protease YdiL (CAAX protease family)